MTYAQIPTSTALETGGWMVAAAAVVGIAVLVLTLMEKWRIVFGKQDRASEPVTRHEFDVHLLKSDENRDRLIRDFTARMERAEKRLAWNTVVTVRIAERMKIDLHRETDNPDL